MKRRFTIVYRENLSKTDPATNKMIWIGDRKCQCDVEVEIDVDAIASILGARACRNKSGKATASNSMLKVKRIGQPKELSREMRTDL
jgi:hypothetical protein